MPKDDEIMVTCDACGEMVAMDDAEKCGCGMTLCEQHAAPEDHDCKA